MKLLSLIMSEEKTTTRYCPNLGYSLFIYGYRQDIEEVEVGR